MQKYPKILLFDVEIMANLAWVWQKYDTDVIEFESEFYILSVAYKWLGDKNTQVITLRDFKSYKQGTNNDKSLVQEIWKLFNEADIIVGHNSNKFDIRKVNAKFLIHGLKPPSPSKYVDTLLVARKHFAFNSNKLDDLANILGIGHKTHTGGWKLWKGCYLDDDSAWVLMARYNKQDVVLLEKLYLTMLPWMSHPNRNLYQGTNHSCPNCGSKKCQRRGTEISSTTVYQRWQCQDCGKWSKSTMKDNSVNR